MDFNFFVVVVVNICIVLLQVYKELLNELEMQRILLQDKTFDKTFFFG